jgi:O-antigen ligase
MGVSLAVPNLVYSGMSWFQTLHFMKWVVALVPLAVLSIVAGLVVAFKGTEKVRFTIDPFGWIWFAFLLYVTAQPLWTEIKSVPTFVREWFFFASLWVAYVLCYNFLPRDRFRWILWGANLNAACNVLFAELQSRNLSGPFAFILPTPGNYIGNTGQQEMFGLWVAMACLNSIYLHVAYGREDGAYRRSLPVRLANILLLVINAWGLWGSTTRAAILSLCVAVAVMALVAWRNEEARHLRRLGGVLSLLVLGLVATVLFNAGRAGSLESKWMDVLKNPETVGGRIDIWATSWTMITQQPLKGVGLGQFKWHYLDAQKEMFRRFPDREWKFTMWAHNEYLQFFAEFGLPGGLLVIALLLWLLWAFLGVVMRREKIPLEALWALAMLALIWFDALWSRPFRRIENALWISVAFAFATSVLLPKLPWSALRRPALQRGMGALFAGGALFGLVFLGQGIKGDRTIAKAMQAPTPQLQRALLEEAKKALMVRDIAERQIGKHLIALAQISKDMDLLTSGLNRLWFSFKSESTAEDLMALIDWGNRLRNRQVLDALLPYLKPGTYQRVEPAREMSLEPGPESGPVLPSAPAVPSGS